MNTVTDSEFFKYFFDICKIPHGSGNEDGIVSYLIEFAQKHELEYYTDEYKNVLINKKASLGCENCDGIVFQGHTDMVCEKTSDSEHNFLTDPIEWYSDGEFIRAKNTTLGADDGIAVAMMLSLLADTDTPMPFIQCLFTSEEETGLCGASNFDYSKLTCKYLLNIDGEEEDFILSSCAGGIRLNLYKDCKTFECKDPYRISIKGLRGGHSGVDINKGHINANNALSSFLLKLAEKYGITLASFEGGRQDNAICSSAHACICGISLEDLKKEAQNAEKELKKYEQDACIECDLCSEKSSFTFKDTCDILTCISSLKGGVIKMSDEIDGLVQTSANIGIVNAKNGRCEIHTSIRSSIDEEKELICKENSDIGKRYGFSSQAGQSYPGWKFQKESMLRKLYSDAYASVHGGKTPTVCAIHAGLECGIISGKLPDVDIISVGPDMCGVHSPDERVSINSCKRVYQTILKLIKNITEN